MPTRPHTEIDLTVPYIYCKVASRVQVKFQAQKSILRKKEFVLLLELLMKWKPYNKTGTVLNIRYHVQESSFRESNNVT